MLNSKAVFMMNINAVVAKVPIQVEVRDTNEKLESLGMEHLLVGDEQKRKTESKKCEEGWPWGCKLVNPVGMAFERGGKEVFVCKNAPLSSFL